MKYHILHTEASMGLGGQELRILHEAEGMRRRGHNVIMAVVEGGRLVAKARDKGFTVYELPLQHKRHALKALKGLRHIIQRHTIEIINTHSSWDAWMGGMAARSTGKAIVRTRHLSTPTRPGLNSRMLYRTLADAVVTTCEETAQTIREQAKLTANRCRSIPTGVDPTQLTVTESELLSFQNRYGLTKSDLVIGTVCVLRFWKGITEMIQAAKLLENHTQMKWLIVGDGPSRAVFEQQCRDLGIQDRVIFTGYLDRPQVALAAMDIFLLLSTAHEGVSQASLQAAYLKRPLITTPTGGLKEVCLPDSTGFLAPPHRADIVAQHIQSLAADESMRQRLGINSHRLVVEQFTLEHTLDQMEQMYAYALRKSKK